MPTIAWLKKPQRHDYDAAQSFLLLLFKPAHAARIVERLRTGDVSHFKAKDISRASGLPLLPKANRHVRRDSAKISRGEPLSPILLVRDRKHGRTIIADGYHRMCAVYAASEDAAIACVIA